MNTNENSMAQAGVPTLQSALQGEVRQAEQFSPKPKVVRENQDNPKGPYCTVPTQKQDGFRVMGPARGGYIEISFSSLGEAKGIEEALNEAYWMGKQSV